MKDKGIARDVGGRKRAAGDAPNLGQISRMSSNQPDSSDKGERRRRRRTSDDGGGRQNGKQKADRRSATLVWTLTLGFLALGLIALVFVFWLKPLMDRRDTMSASAARPAKLMPVETAAMPRSNFGEKEAISLAKRAMTARDEAEVEAAIHTGSVPPATVIASLKAMRAGDGDIVRYDWISRLDTTRPDMEGVLVTFKKDDKERNRLILLSPGAGKSWKMDYAAFARLAVPAWSELVEGRVNTAVVRVYVAADQYYNGPFQEAEGWKCYGLASPDLPELMFGYCKAGTQQKLAIARTLEGVSRPMRMTLEIEKVEGADARQYVIKRVLAQDWAIGKTALDEE